MDFTAICNEVYTITNRPDLIAETEIAVKSATLKAHGSDYYYKDLFETGVSFPTAEYVQSLEIKTIIPRFRSLSYIRKTDATGADTDVVLQILTPQEVVDYRGANRENCCYMAGQTIQIRSSTELQYIFLGCYIYPDIVPASYSSWVADEYPYAIIFDAAATIFKMTGHTEEFTAYKTLVSEQLAILRMNNILASGY